MAPILSNRTNSDSSTHQSYKAIRRVQSSRQWPFNLDSDDSFPSEHSSIYDAPLVLSDKNGHLEGQTLSTLDLQASLPLSPSLENLDQPAALPSIHTIQMQEAVPPSHSNWPPVQLETITEQHSISTLHTSISLPHLNTQATQDFSIDGDPHSSTSTTQQPPFWPLNCPATKASFGRRSSSENDASCPRLLAWKGKCSIYKEYHSNSSSSSDELLTTRCLAIQPTYPLRPRYPPPERSPTPPGLPTFGTQEAVELFQIPGTRCASAHNAQGRTLQRNRLPSTLTGEDLLRPMTPVLRPVVSSTSVKGKSVARRIIHSFCRPPTGDVREGEARRASLPAGFVARADDGTYVRGRFGARNSGHGVGARTGQQSVGLEGHKFHHLEPAGRTLEVEVREIDKACQVTERTRAQGVEDNMRAGVPRLAQSAMPQCPIVIPEYGGPSRTCAPNWRIFWPPRVNATAIQNLQEAVVPLATRPRVDSQPRPVTAERMCDGSRTLQRRISAESAILVARPEREENRNQGENTWEARCWKWSRGWCCVESLVEKEVSTSSKREIGGEGSSTRPRVLESEEPSPPNARMVYPTLVSEDEAAI
jgi:hypothetical protein